MDAIRFLFSRVSQDGAPARQRHTAHGTRSHGTGDSAYQSTLQCPPSIYTAIFNLASSLFLWAQWGSRGMHLPSDRTDEKYFPLSCTCENSTSFLNEKEKPY